MKQVLLIMCFFVISVNISFTVSISHDDNYPIVGREVPNWEFKGKDGQKIALRDFRGQNVILDFWAEGCVACIKNFPKIDSLQEEYSGSVKFILVGKLNNNIEYVYQKYKSKFDLKLTSFFDAEIFKSFRIQGVPRIIWIDKNGIVQAIGGTNFVSRENIERFIKGKEIEHFDQSYTYYKINEELYDVRKPFQVKNNGGVDGDFQFRSMLTIWKPGMATGGQGNIIYNLPRFEVLKRRLTSLYKIAYTGSDNLPRDFYNDIIFETTDSIMIREKNLSGAELEGFYCYSLYYPKSKVSPEYTARLMKEDLKRYFDHDCVIEERNMPCWLLTEIDSANFSKISSKGGKFQFLESSIRFEFRNASMEKVAKILGSRLTEGEHVFSAFDSDVKVDLTLNTLMYDFESVKKALNKNGIDIVRGTRMMKVLIIKPIRN